MNGAKKVVQLSEHAKEQLQRRGTNEKEIIEAIHKGNWQPAELGRSECRHEFEFNQIWNGKFYKRKQVRPIFVEEHNIIVVTVYVYYS